MPTYDSQGNVIPSTTGANPINDLLQTLIGKQTGGEEKSSQDTTGTTSQNQTGTQNTTGAQNTASTNTTNGQTINNTQQTQNQSGLQTSGTTSAQNQTGTTTNRGSTNTSGTTATTGNVRTTGTINTRNGGTITNTNVEQTNADTTALESVFAKQSQGVSPEMLAAIFQQGSKAAPDLVTAQSNALGARAVGNTPVAQVLNQLQGDLTAKAADLSRQMLSDSASTAAKIADLTKSTTSTGTQVQDTFSTQVQDLLQATDTKQLVQQLSDTINEQVQSMDTVGSQNTTQRNTSFGTTNTANQQTQNQTQKGTQATTSNQTQNNTQNMTGTQTQNVDATKESMQRTTINTQVAQSLAGMAAAGLGINELLKAATGKGFVGNAKDLISWLAKTGTDVTKIPGISDVISNLDLSSIISNSGGVIGNTDIIAGDIDLGGLLDGFLSGWADGGQVNTETQPKFLPVPDLLKKKQKAENPDKDIESLLTSLMGDASMSMLGIGNLGGGGSSGAKTPSNVESEFIGNSLGGETSGAAVGNIGTANGGTGVSNNAAGMLGAIASAITGIPGLQTAAKGINGMLNEQAGMVNAEAADMGMNESAAVANATGFGPSGVMGIDAAAQAAISAALGLSSDSSIGPGSDSNGLGAGSAASDAGVGDSAGSGDGQGDAGSGSVGGDSGGESGDAWADGGRVIKGPGTGISDSVPAIGPNGPMRVANNEYIIPADVVEHFGVSAFDQLCAAVHTPASVQRKQNGY